MSYTNNYVRKIDQWSFEDARGIEAMPDPIAIRICSKLEDMRIPLELRQEVLRLAYYAIKSGIKLEDAINSALRYILEYEFPDKYPSYHHLLHRRGKVYRKCMQIWREKGLIREVRGISERYLLLVRSDSFKETLLNIYPNSQEVERIIKKLERQAKEISSGNLWDVVVKALRRIDDSGIISRGFEVLINEER